MDNIETMDLSGGDSEGFTNLAQTYEPEKNMNKEQKMDSSPISDVMGGADWETASMGPPPAMPPQTMAMAPPHQQAPPPVKKPNPFNLTDEQMEALLVGLVAVLAFSKPVQEKLASLIPQVASEPQGMTSLVVTGLVAALIFYFGKRFVMP